MKLLRLLYILWIFLRYRIDSLLPSSRVKNLLRCFVLFYPPAWINNSLATRGKRLRFALEKLGPIFVKFGQALSTRPDLLPDDLIIELSKLQYQVSPSSEELVMRILEQAYGKPVSEVFASFSIQPLASASVAQAHEAKLPDGSEVVVKIIRPGIKKAIQRDIDLLYFLARFVMKRWENAKRFRPVEVVQEFEGIIFDELDMLREAASAARLRSYWVDSELLYVPNIYWDFCRSNILVIERIYGIRISDTATLRSLDVDMKKLAERGVEIFYSQVFRDNFFHADMHPGNIFVDISDPKNPKYIGVDFGIMGTLNERDQYYLAQNFLAFFNRDYRKVAQLHIDSGWVALHTRVDELESAMRTVCEPIFNKPLSEISFAMVLVRLFQVARRFNMEVQPQLVLLQKTLLNVEGLGRQLYPNLNLWETAKPHLESVMRKQLGWRGLFHKLQQRFPEWLERLPELSDWLGHNQHKIISRDLEKRFQDLQLEFQEQQKNQRRLSWVSMGLIILLTISLLIKGLYHV